MTLSSDYLRAGAHPIFTGGGGALAATTSRHRGREGRGAVPYAGRSGRLHTNQAGSGGGGTPSATVTDGSGRRGRTSSQIATSSPRDGQRSLIDRAVR